MSESSFLGDSASLASRVAGVLSQEHRFAYAQVSPDLRIISSSPNFQELIGDHQTHFINQPVAEVLWEFVGAEEALQEVLNSVIPAYRLERVNRLRADESTGYINYLVVPLEEHRADHGLLLIIEDVTPTGQLEQHLIQDRNELRLAREHLSRVNEELRRLNTLKSLFLTIAAHDLRSPLTVILGHVDLLRDQLACYPLGNLNDSFSIISTQVEWLNNLIVNILDLDQIERSELVLFPRPCDLVAIVKETTAFMREMARVQDLAMKVDFPNDPIPVVGDPDRIKQILLNLINNALKYTPPGGQVLVSTWVEGASVGFQVKDNGPGMTEEELSHLFELYYRTPGVRKSGKAGTGLGLFIVKSLVNAHHGEIQVSSQPGHGTIFTVRLPVRSYI